MPSNRKTCCVCGINSRQVTFHRFPKTDLLMKWEEWCQAHGIASHGDTFKWTYICGAHFNRSDYRRNSTMLKKYAVPSILKAMEVPRVTIKHETLDNFTLTTEEPNVNYETQVLDAPKIKLEPNFESCSDVSNLDQELKLSEETEMIRCDSNYVWDCSLFESQPKQQGSDIKLKGSEKIEIEKMFEFVDVQCKIENDELNIKEEENNMHQEPRFLLNQNIKQEDYIDCLVDQTNNETTNEAIEKEKTTYNSGLDGLKLCPYKLTKGVKKYKCDQCDFASFLKISLNQHILQHKKPKEVPTCKLSCDQCEFVTLYKDNLKKHRTRHENGKKFKCGQCEYVTAFRTHFQHHTLRHNTSGKLFQCDQCLYLTNQEDKYNRHLIVHKSREKGSKYKCGECKFSTVHITSLTKHAIRKHKNPALKM